MAHKATGSFTTLWLSLFGKSNSGIKTLVNKQKKHNEIIDFKR